MATRNDATNEMKDAVREALDDWAETVEPGVEIEWDGCWYRLTVPLVRVKDGFGAWYCLPSDYETAAAVVLGEVDDWNPEDETEALMLAYESLNGELSSKPTWCPAVDGGSAESVGMVVVEEEV